ncbi:MAG TPA: nucleoside 2-deoxyribosyltransferase domain-containing protein [Alphaproteobacteria bacterium]|nr:nucleoside 2-deoxyribosyltransferase domain-containing protein [Alphaproteobacteria bacterium]
MNIVYARQPLPEKVYGNVPNSLFLAGPTPRDKNTPSWRPEALAMLEKLGFTGTVFVPEDEEWGLSDVIYHEQTRWEIEALGASSVVVFWIPRDLAHMPAFTTNTEYGLCVALIPDFMVLGCPDTAKKVAYQKQLAADIQLVHNAFAHQFEDGPRFENLKPIPTSNTLQGTLLEALKLIPH